MHDSHRSSKPRARRRESITVDLAKRAARPKMPARPLEYYAGTYVHPHFGSIVVEPRGNRLAARMGVRRMHGRSLRSGEEAFRVDFIGSGWVMGTRSIEGASHPAAVQLLDAEFTRRE